MLDGIAAYMLNETQEFLFASINSHNLVSLHFCYANTIHKLTVFIEMKIKIVREDNIIEGLLVACELFLVTMRVASIKVIVANILCLDVEHRHAIFATGYIVRRTALHSLGFIYDAQFG